jgi:hypothetical protein
MLHILLLAVFTAGVATLTFALMALASMVSAGYRSRAVAVPDCRAALGAGLARPPTVASDGTPPLSGSGAV